MRLVRARQRQARPYAAMTMFLVLLLGLPGSGCAARTAQLQTLSLTLSDGSLGSIVISDAGQLRLFDACWRSKTPMPAEFSVKGDVAVVRATKKNSEDLRWSGQYFVTADGKVFSSADAAALWRQMTVHLFTPENVASLIGRASSLDLVASRHPYLSGLRLQTGQQSVLADLLLGGRDLCWDDESNDSPPWLRAPGYVVSSTDGDRTVTLSVVEEDACALQYGDWPAVHVVVPGISLWAARSLPIPPASPGSLASLYSYQVGKLVGPRDARTYPGEVIDAFIVPQLTIAVPEAAADASVKRPDGPAHTQLTLTCSGRPEVTIAVWDDWFEFGGRRYFADGIGELLWGIPLP